MVTHTFDSNTREREADGLSSKPAWSTHGVPEQPGLQRPCLKTKTKRKSPKPITGMCFPLLHQLHNSSIQKVFCRNPAVERPVLP